MGKLDVSLLRYLERAHFRTLLSVEMGMKNHAIVSAQLIAAIARINAGGVHKILRELSKHRLVCYERGKKYDGYRLTNLGYDYLALKALTARGVIHGFGSQIGTGKESNIYVVEDSEGRSLCLKLHRLGRTCFRKIREKRDYHKQRAQMSWLYLSRISATKEFEYMKALYDRGFPVPKPIDANRHCVLMELVDGVNLQNVTEVGDPAKLFDDLMNLHLRLANCGVIHGDFNEFNLMVNETTSEPVVIDFPQMISTSHPDARMHFERDVNCLRDFFTRRFNYCPESVPTFDDVEREDKLDAEIAASGITKQMEKELLLQYGMIDDDDDEELSEEDHDEVSDEDEDKELEVESGNGTKRAINKESEAMRPDFESAMNDLESKVQEQTPLIVNNHSSGDEAEIESVLMETRSIACSSMASIAPEVVRRRVKMGMEKQRQQEIRGRMKAKGEASAVTRQRRDNRHEIKSSTNAFWADD